MDLSQLPLFKLIDRRLDWLNQRQAVLAQNIANADTPHYRPRDLEAFDFRRLARLAAKRIEPTRTDPAHFGGVGAASGSFDAAVVKETYETNLAGNAVVLEEQLMKVSETGMDHELATRLYRKYLGLFRIAVGRGGTA